MQEIKVTFNTITPLWTGDAWGDNDKIRPSSLMGSLRFWFDIYLQSCGISGESGSDDFTCNLDFSKLEEKMLSSIENEKNVSVDYAIKSSVNNLKIPLVSQIFGCTGWKSRITIKDINQPKIFKLRRDEINFDFLIKEKFINKDTEFWTKQLLFSEEKNEIKLFKNISFSLRIDDIYLNDMKRFFSFYKDKIILCGGKKSFGFGFCKISSDFDLSDSNFLSNCNQKNIKFQSRIIEIDNLPSDKNVLGFNFKYYQRLREKRKYRAKNFGKIGEASKFFFSAHLLNGNGKVYIFGFKDFNDNLFKQLLEEKYSNFR